MSQPPETLTVVEQHQLLDSLLCKSGSRKQFRRGVRNYLIACLMLEAGLRVGEVCKLQIRDLYWNGDPVINLVVRKEIAKNKKERVVPVSGRLRNALSEYHTAVNRFEDSPPDTFVFVTRPSFTPITTRQVERLISAAAERSIGRPVNPHVLRHTFATRLMRVTDMRTVQELLGHSSVTSTQIYTHPNSDDKVLAIRALDSPSPA